MNPRISIVIPTYNVSKYVEKCLLSVLNQDFKGSFEVLVIDDCGIDDSINKVDAIINMHPRGRLIRIIHHETNKGLGPSRNTGIDNAQGKYIFFLDSDDWISQDCMSILYNKIVETDADFVVGSVKRIEENTERLKSSNIYPDTIVEVPGAGVYMTTHSPDFHIEVWNKLYKTDFLRKNSIRFVHRIFEDYYFDFRLRASANKIALVHDVTLFYNIRQNSILTTLKASNGSDESVRTFCEIIQYLKQMVLNEYSSVEGIYDLYFERMIWVFENFKRYRYSVEQWRYIDEHITGFCSFVPSLDLLSINRHRNIYSRLLENETIANLYSVKARVDKISLTKRLIIYCKIITNKLFKR